MPSAHRYAQQVVAGSVPAGTYVRLACQRYLRDRRKWRGTRPGRAPYWFDAEKGQHAINFFQFLRHSKGEWAGTVFALSPWQEFIVWNLFGWKRRDGTRRFRMAYTEVPRKNGKSTFSAGIGLYLFFADGEPGAEVYTAATKRDQARIVHGEAVRMVKRSPLLGKHIKAFKDNLHVFESASKYEPLGADADTMDGLNVHGAIIDELHAHKTREVFDVLDTATGARRQPLLFIITTAGYDRQSVCWQQHEYGVKVLEGSLVDETVFVFIAGLDTGDQWDDPEAWARANPNLHVSVKLDDLERKAAKARATPAAQNAFMRLHGNRWTEQYQRWIPVETWEQCDGKVDQEALVGQPAYGGLDLSATTDLTAWVLAVPDGDMLSLVCRFWLPGDDLIERGRRDRVPYETWVRQGFLEVTEGNVVDYDVVRARINEDGARFQVKEIAYDPWNAQQLANQLGEEDGFQMVQMRQGFASLSAPTKEFQGLVVSRKIRHGQHPVLQWMLSNVAVKMDEAGNVKPDKGRSGGRIDGIVASIMATSRARMAVQHHSVYEDRGLVTI